MTLSCNKTSLQDALGLAVRAVASRSTLPILECVLLTASPDNGLTLSASNLDLSIDTAPIDANITVAGAVAVDAKLFAEIVRKMPGDSISITVDEKYNVQLKSGRSKLNIMGQPADDFPVQDNATISAGANSYILNNQVVKDMIRQTIFSVSTDMSKLILTGELIEVKENNLRMVAVDMYRISYKSTTLPEGSADAKAVVPAKALNELSRMLPIGESETVAVQLSGNRIIFAASNFTLTSNLLEGEFIRYDQIFNEDFLTIVNVDRDQLLSTFERAVLIASENKMLPTKLQIEDDVIKVTSVNEKGETSEEDIPCSTEGKALTISFNPRYFIDALRAIDEENITLKLNTQLSPCTIKGSEENYKYLIVPLRPEA